MIKCNKCGYIGEDKEFPIGHDFFQCSYVSGCPKCDNQQNPGDASMRIFGGKRPFERVETMPIKVTDLETAIMETIRRANEVS